MNLLFTSNRLSPLQFRLSQALRIIAAFILFQSLFYKFGAHPDSVALFSMLDLEPWGRIGLGTLELIVVILLIVPKTQLIGSFLGIGIMSGAIFTHLFEIGIVFREDGGRLFTLAILCWSCCLINFLLFLKLIRPY